MQYIFVVGYSRSGTSVVQKAIGSVIDCKLLIEPHALWKIGDWASLNDESEWRSEVSVQKIRRRLNYLADRKAVVVEKSPPNVYRPNLLKQIAPHAIVVYVERDRDHVIASNISKSLGRQSLSFFNVITKYIRPERFKLEDKGQFSAQVQATGGEDIVRQVGVISLGFVAVHFLVLKTVIWFRGVRVPFGPKGAGWLGLRRDSDLFEYYARELDKVAEIKKQFEHCFEDRFYEFKYEEFKECPEKLFDRLKQLGFAVDTEAASLVSRNIRRARL